VKEGAARDVKYDYGEDEELHVLITGDKQEDVSAMCMCGVLFLLPFHCRLQRAQSVLCRSMPLHPWLSACFRWANGL
jgi:hypothetical protein